MREFKSFNLNLNMLGFAIMVPLLSAVLFGVIEINFQGTFDLISDEIKLSFLTLSIVLVISFILLSLNFTIVNNRGIEIRTLFPKITMKKKSWREIKYYAHVIETWTGEHGSSDWKVIWFIDFDDKVCVRIPRRGSFNLKNVMKQVSDFEDKFEIELKFRNPYLTAYGWKKIKYPKDLNKNEKKFAE